MRGPVSIITDHHEDITRCRACHGASLTTVLSLGELPLANDLADSVIEAKRRSRYPLTVVRCPSCTLVQIIETIYPQVLFSRYPYFSSYSTTLLQHARGEAEQLIQYYRLGPESLVVEIASNDGYLLRNFVEAGIPVLGIDPAENITHTAAERGVPTLCEFFGLDTALRLREEGRRANVVIANNVLAHINDLSSFVDGIATLLAKDGIAVLEFPYLFDLVETTAFDTMYHEHLSYFSIRSVKSLFEAHGLDLIDVEHQEIHGGSLRVFLRHRAPGHHPSPRMAIMERREEDRDVNGSLYLDRFGLRVAALRTDLVAELSRRLEAGQKIAAYGASAKGTTLLAYCGIDDRMISFIVDISPVKQGKYAPGTGIPIMPTSALMELMPDAVLLLTWNFEKEIIGQQSDFLRRGGTFIVPVPEVHTIGKEVLP